MSKQLEDSRFISRDGKNGLGKVAAICALWLDYPQSLRVSTANPIKIVISEDCRGMKSMARQFFSATDRQLDDFQPGTEKGDIQ